jgi:hypothetical protein
MSVFSIKTLSVTFALALTNSACGGGGNTTAAATTQTTQTQTTSATTTTGTSDPTSTAIVISNVTTTTLPTIDPTTMLSAKDSLNGRPITDPAIIAKFAAFRGKVTQLTKDGEAARYPLHAGDTFQSYVAFAAGDPILATLGEVGPNASKVVFGVFASFAAARIFPCIFDPGLSPSDCDVIGPDAWSSLQGTAPNQFYTRYIGLGAAGGVQQYSTTKWP